MRPKQRKRPALGALRPGHKFRARIVGVLRDPLILRKHMDLFDASSRARMVTARRLEFKNLYVPFDKDRDSVSLLLAQLGDIGMLSMGEELLQEFFAPRDENPIILSQKRWIDFVGEYVDEAGKRRISYDR